MSTEYVQPELELDTSEWPAEDLGDQGEDTAHASDETVVPA